MHSGDGLIMGITSMPGRYTNSLKTISILTGTSGRKKHSKICLFDFSPRDPNHSEDVAVKVDKPTKELMPEVETEVVDA